MDRTLLIVLIALDALAILLAAVLFFRYRHLSRAYGYFMKGRDAESLEGYVRNLSEQVLALQAEDSENKEAIRMLNKNQRASFQKYGVVHYNAFKGMGGNLSFACALLDYTNSGFVLNSVHSREGCYVYIKRVDRGTTDIVLGSEEQEALEQALGYIQPDQQ